MFAKVFTCPFCQIATAHPRDYQECYCSRCKVFVTDILLHLRAELRQADVPGQYGPPNITYMSPENGAWVLNALVLTTPGFLVFEAKERIQKTIGLPSDIVKRAVEIITERTKHHASNCPPSTPV